MSLGISEKKLWIEGKAGKIEAILSEPHEPSESSELGDKPLTKIVGIICHPHPLYQGTMQNKVVTTMAKAWQQMGLSTVRFNFRGVGESEGSYDEGSGEQEDLKSVIEFVLESSPSVKLFLGGFSFGAYIAAQIAANGVYPILALLSVAPPLRLFPFSFHPLPLMPWIIIQGEKDELSSYEEVIAWVEDMKKTKSDITLVSLDASHFFHGKLTELKEEIIKEMNNQKIVPK